MKQLFLCFLAPGWNRCILLGFLLTLIGLATIPVLIGIPIAGFGFSLFAVGVIVSVLQKIPGGPRIVSAFEKSLASAVCWLKGLIEEIRR